MTDFQKDKVAMASVSWFLSIGMGMGFQLHYHRRWNVDAADFESKVSQMRKQESSPPRKFCLAFFTSNVVNPYPIWCKTFPWKKEPGVSDVLQTTVCQLCHQCRTNGFCPFHIYHHMPLCVYVYVLLITYSTFTVLVLRNHCARYMLRVN